MSVVARYMVRLPGVKVDLDVAVGEVALAVIILPPP